MTNNKLLSFIKKIEEFSYKRYNFFVILNNVGKFKDKLHFLNKEEISGFIKKLFPFFIKDIDKLSKEEILSIYEVLKTEITKEKSKKTFMQSFHEVANSSRFELFIKQILHYYTTYGKDAGIYKGRKIYIDNEEFDTKIIEEIVLIELKDFNYFKEKFIKDLYTTLQWTSNELENIKIILSKTGIINEIDLDKINSKELKYIIIEEFNLIPSNPEEFFKSLLYILTEDSLIINNKEYIEKIQDAMTVSSNAKKIEKLLKKYIQENNIEKLASIFNRYKNFFINLKYKNEEVNTKKIINKISKLSKKYHKPKKLPDYLKISDMIENFEITETKFLDICNELDTVYLIKLANLLKKRKEIINKNIYLDVYLIRNGKYWFKEKVYYGNYTRYLWLLKKLIGKRITQNLIKLIEEDKLYIDIKEIANYGIPFSGKKFLGNVPYGTLIKNFNVVGVYWENIKYNNKNKRIDLDLSLTNFVSKIGWDGSWNEENSIIFSGDMTDAKNGAVESFYIKNYLNNNIYILNLNWFNYTVVPTNEEIKVPYTLFFGNIKNEKEIPKTTMIDEVTFSIKEYISNKNPYQELGILVDNNFYITKLLRVNYSFCSNASINNEKIFNLLKVLATSFIRFDDIIENINFNSINNKLKEIDEIKKLNQKEITKDILLKLVD